MILTDLPDLLPGDVLFYSPSELVGLLIAVKTWTWLSHVEAVWDSDGKVISARIEGVNIYPIRVDKHLVCIRRPHSFDMAKGDDAIKPLIGRDYEIPALERFFNPWSKRRHVARICSSVVTAYLRGGGIEPFNPAVSADQIAPAQLWQTPVLNTIWIKGGWLKQKLHLHIHPPT